MKPAVCTGHALAGFNHFMSRPSYSEKLRDPRWQKMRLQIFERDSFECQLCGSGSKTLNAHHLVYEKGKNPWEVDPRFVTTLCEPCHSRVECTLSHCRVTLGLSRESDAVFMLMIRAFAENTRDRIPKWVIPAITGILESALRDSGNSEQPTGESACLEELTEEELYWRAVCKLARKQRPLIAGNVEKAKIREISGSVVKVDTTGDASTLTYDLLSGPNNTRLLEGMLSEVMGEPVRIEYIH